MKLVFFGTPDYAVPSLQRLLAQPSMTVVGVVTQPDKRRGRGSQTTPSPVKALALAHDLPVHQPRRLKKAAQTLDWLAATNADAFVVVAYGQLLSPPILAMPRLGCINGHGSILPRYRGAAPIQWCLYNGDPETGVTTMLMDAGMDSGPMLRKATQPIGILDNAQTLAVHLAHLTADLLIDTLLAWEQGHIQPQPQPTDPSQITYARLLHKEDYGLDWQRSALALHHQVRGFYPHCTLPFRNQSLKILATVPLNQPPHPQLPAEFHHLVPAHLNRAEPGTILALAKPYGPIIQTSQGGLLLREVQPPGKRPQSGLDFANGARLQVGDRL